MAFIYTTSLLIGTAGGGTTRSHLKEAAGASPSHSVFDVKSVSVPKHTSGDVGAYVHNRISNKKILTRGGLDFLKTGGA